MHDRYEIRVRGHLSPALATSFGDLVATPEPAETVLHGALRDQAELFGVLDRLQALGLDLVEVRRLVADDAPGTPSSRPASTRAATSATTGESSSRPG